MTFVTCLKLIRTNYLHKCKCVKVGSTLESWTGPEPSFLDFYKEIHEGQKSNHINPQEHTMASQSKQQAETRGVRRE